MSTRGPGGRTRAQLVLSAVLGALRPLVTLLVRSGVAYPAFASALKRVFLDAAAAELARRGATPTDSALSLLSGVHRRDVRTLNREPAGPSARGARPPSVAAELCARWLADPACVDAAGRPLPLRRSGAAPSFEALASAVSRDVRPRTLIDELVGLGVAAEDGESVTLLEAGFAPRQGLAEMLALMQANLADHAASAVANVQGEADFLEQSMFVDELAAESAEHLQRATLQAWRRMFAELMPAMIELHRADAALTGSVGRVRVRVGVYFHRADEPASCAVDGGAAS